MSLELFFSSNQPTDIKYMDIFESVYIHREVSSVCDSIDLQQSPYLDIILDDNASHEYMQTDLLTSLMREIENRRNFV